MLVFQGRNSVVKTVTFGTSSNQILAVLEKLSIGSILLGRAGGVFVRELATCKMARPLRVDAWICDSSKAKKPKPWVCYQDMTRSPNH